jgi:hypothetical protein
MATSGWALRFGSTTMVTLSRDCALAPSGAIEWSTISCEPGGRGGGTKANSPAVSLTTRAWTAPLRISSTVAPAAARPAMTLSPEGSMRTMSKEGTAAPATAGAAAGRSGGRGLPAASAGGAAGRGSAADGGAGSAADRRGADNSPGTEAARSRLGAGASGLVWGPGVAGAGRSADSSGTPWRVGRSGRRTPNHSTAAPNARRPRAAIAPPRPRPLAMALRSLTPAFAPI